MKNIYYKLTAKLFRKKIHLSLIEFQDKIIEMAAPHFGADVCVSVMVTTIRYNEKRTKIEYKANIHTNSFPAVISSYDNHGDMSNCPQECIKDAYGYG